MARERLSRSFVDLLFIATIQMMCERPSLSKDLPQQVLIAIGENQKTFQAVKTIQATVRRVSNHRFEAGTRELLAVQRLWYDGYHSRLDYVESRFTGENTANLLTGEDPAGRQAYFAPPPVGSLEIQSVESRLSFHDDVAFIWPPKWDQKQIRQDNPILAYQMFLRHSIQEKVLESAAAGYSFTARVDRVADDDCILLSCDYDGESVLNFWLVPSKGYCVKKMQNIWKGKVYNEYETTLKEYTRGHWWFDSVRARNWKGQEDEPYEDVRLTVESLMFNEPIDPKVFTIAGTGIPPGTKIADRVSNLNYVYGLAQPYGQDVDFALDALKEAMEDGTKTSERAEANEVPPTLRVQGNPMNASESAAPRATGNPFLLVGTGLAVCLFLLACVLYARRMGKP